MDVTSLCARTQHAHSGAQGAPYICPHIQKQQEYMQGRSHSAAAKEAFSYSFKKEEGKGVLHTLSVHSQIPSLRHSFNYKQDLLFDVKKIHKLLNTFLQVHPTKVRVRQNFHDLITFLHDTK